LGGYLNILGQLMSSKKICKLKTATILNNIVADFSFDLMRREN